MEEGPWPAKAYWDADELAKQRAAGHYFDYGYTRPAVVTRGHVESGMPTEGNVPTGGDFFNRDAKGSPTPAEPADEDNKKNDKDNSKEEFPDDLRVPEPVKPQGDTPQLRLHVARPFPCNATTITAPMVAVPWLR